MKIETSPTTAKRLRHHMTARLYRLIVALLTGPLPREAADRVAGASNSPHYIQELRNNFHLKIHTERVEKIDRDGLITRPGVYHLLPESRELAKLLTQSDSPPSPANEKAA